MTIRKISLNNISKNKNLKLLQKQLHPLTKQKEKEILLNTAQYVVGESIFTGIESTNQTPNYEQDYTFLINSNDMIIQYSLKTGVPYEKNLIASMSAYLPKGGTMLDIGTNIGTVAIPMSRAQNKNCKIYAFEPFSKNYVLFQENCKLNHCDNIISFPVAVGDKYRDSVSLSSSILKIMKKGKVRKATVPDSEKNDKKDNDKNDDKDDGKDDSKDDGKDDSKAFNYGAIQLGIGGEKVRMVSIDNLGIDYDVMKVDIEGSEPLAFYGAKESIKRCMPVIAFEHNANTVTDDMRKSLNISNEVANFNIIKYCYGLGYRKIVQFPFDNYMLIPPNRQVVKPNNIWKYKQVSIFKKFKPKELSGYKLYDFIIPNYKKIKKFDIKTKKFKKQFAHLQV